MTEQREAGRPELGSVACLCKCVCKRLRSPSGEPPTLCYDCQVFDGLGDDAHGLVYAPAAMTPLAPLEPISDAQKDAALAQAVARLGL
jgi:hypothetical protein